MNQRPSRESRNAQRSERSRANQIKKYNEVVEKAELIDIKLVESKFDVKTEYFLHLRAEGDNDGSIKFAFESEFLSCSIDKKEGYLVGQFSWEAVGKHSRKHLLKIRSTYVVSYSGVTGVDENAAKVFLQRVGRIATYPYFRHLVAVYSSDSGAELPILPVYRV